MSEVVTAHLTCPPLVMALDARLLRRIAESAFAAPDFPIRELHVAMHADGLDAPIPAVSDRKKVEHALQAAEAYRARCMSHDPQAEPRTIETLRTVRVLHIAARLSNGTLRARASCQGASSSSVRLTFHRHGATECRRAGLASVALWMCPE